MKKFILIILLVVISNFSFSQNKATSLRKSITAVDLAVLAPEISYEQHLKGLFTLRSSLGFGFSFGQSFFDGGTYFLLTPVFTAEPRCYFDFRRRVAKGKKTSYNAAEYFAITASYATDIVVQSNSDFVRGGNQMFSFVPKLGFKRTVGRKFFFEVAGGIGIGFNKYQSFQSNELDLRFGFYIK
jgi:hypothetical protein